MLIMRMTKITLAVAGALALSSGVVNAADATWPLGDQTFTEDTVLPGYGDISTDQTLTGSKNVTLTIRDELVRGDGASLSVTGGTTTFKDFGTFILDADHTGFGGGYAI